MPGKDTLKSMLNNIVNDKSEDAQVDFHRYLKDKMHTAYTNGSTAPKVAKASEEAAPAQDTNTENE